MPDQLLNTDQELLLQVSEGNEKAFRQLFDQYWDNIYGVAMAFTKSAVTAEEMVQDVFLKIWLQREQLSTIKKFDGYLFTIARNHIFNTLRKKVMEQPFTEALLQYVQETADSPEQQLLFKESEKLVNEAVAGLPPQQQAIYKMSRQQGLSQDEIAHHLQISKHTVKSHMNKALLFIRGYLASHVQGMVYLVLVVKLFW